jgi:hypothetical protein
MEKSLSQGVEKWKPEGSRTWSGIEAEEKNRLAHPHALFNNYESTKY